MKLPVKWQHKKDCNGHRWFVEDAEGEEISGHDVVAALNASALPEELSKDGCPCTVEGIEPCSSACTCARPFMSGGCVRCAKYGSDEQRKAAAQRLACLLSPRGKLTDAG